MAAELGLSVLPVPVNIDLQDEYKGQKIISNLDKQLRIDLLLNLILNYKWLEIK